ncbi:MAG: isochorismatase family cysteine hydrolase [Chloroflexota bacterium]
MAHDPYWDLVYEPQEPPFDAERTALIIIDLQYLDAHPDGWMGRLARDQGKPDHLAERFEFIEEILPNVEQLLEACRTNSVEVIHVRIAFHKRSTRDGKRELLNRLDETPLIPRDYEILDKIAPLEDEIIIDKTSVSAFNSTAIDQILRNMQIDHLWVTGIVTEGCVELTARDAADRGYYVTLVTDACASSTRVAHADAVQRITDGNVIKGRTVDELCALFESMPQSAKVAV